jgi:glycosyltransferase involved in cell wall biosynthesis
MKILYILPAFLHPDRLTSGYLRHYHFIRALSQHHAISLLALATTKVPPDAREAMSKYTERIMTFDATDAWSSSLVNRRPTLFGVGRRTAAVVNRRLAIREMKSAFSRLVQQTPYDLVLLHGKDVFSVIEDWEGLPIVIDFGDATSERIRQSLRYTSITELPWRLLRYLEVRQIEKKLLRKTPHLAFISDRDRDAMLGHTSRAKVIPNGVDLDYWKRNTHSPHPCCIVYTGVMNYPPNADGAYYLLEKILPRVRQSIPNVKVMIVGRDPAPALLKTAQRYPDVTVTGFVDDIRPYLEEATVYAAPLRFASGIQNKLLEALAMEVPVVTTPVAVAGLRVDGGEPPPLLTGAGAEQFAAHLVYLLRQADARARLAAAGRRFVANYFNWLHSAEMLEETCVSAVTQGRQRLCKVVGR